MRAGSEVRKVLLIKFELGSSIPGIAGGHGGGGGGGGGLLTFLRPSVPTDNENNHVRWVIYSNLLYVGENACFLLVAHSVSYTFTRHTQVTTIYRY